jgi:hypothetical protein
MQTHAQKSTGRPPQLPKPDPAEILRFLELLAESGQIIELRLLNVRTSGRQFPYTLSGYFSDYKRLAEVASNSSANAQGAYITLNPVTHALLARALNQIRVAGKDFPLTTDADILKRRWLPIDIDPVRPCGISATEQEHALALERAVQIRNALRAAGWPNPIVGDSGNGGHLLYRIDLPANDGGLVKKFLAALAFRFDDDKATVDQAVSNPSRIWKLYGTVSRKGDSLPDRPHRLARIIETP